MNGSNADNTKGHQPLGRLPDRWIPPPRKSSLAARVFGAMRRSAQAAADRIALPEEDDSPPVGRIEQFLATAPPWLLSMIVHFSFMIVLGFAALTTQQSLQKNTSVDVELGEPIPDDAVFAEAIGEQLDTPTPFASSEGLNGETPLFALDKSLPMVDDPLAGPPLLALGPSGTLPLGTENRPVIATELSGRQLGTKQALVKAWGGTHLTQDAVERGLQWLVRRQKNTGMWSLTGPYSDGSNVENEEAATAMALLALQGDGHTPNSSGGEGFRKAAAQGWRALLRRQQPDGRFYGEVARSHKLYTQAQCTIALCELFGMTRDEAYREPAQRAIDFCVQAQSPEGGWRYEPGAESDMSVTGWFVMALQSARMAGIDVPSPTLEKVNEFLDSVAREDGSRYAYQLRAGATISLTAEGLLCRQYLGWPREDQRLRSGVDFLLEHLPRWDERNVYYWYYATQVCHHMAGSDWQQWNEVMRQLLPEHQEKRGPERGSWSPTGDRWASGGRLYVTCLSLYMLEVYYRHLPLYSRDVLAQ